MLTAALVLTLAVGIGATVCVFSVLHAVLLRPLAFTVTDHYVEAVGMPLRLGRTLQPADMSAGAAAVVVINERLAALAWPGEDPIGKRLSTWTAPGVPEWREVVGVVG